MKIVSTPLQRWELLFINPVSIIVLPLFALFNAGITIDHAQLADNLLKPVTAGVGLGLFFGKVLGITGFSWLALKLKLSTLPPEVTLKHITGASLLASIGFTMSIFITELAFIGEAELILQAKLGILISSLVSGILGYIWLYKLHRL